MSRPLNEVEIDPNDNMWDQYLELLRERRGEKWYQLAKEEGPPNFEDGMRVKVHGTEGSFEFKIARIKEETSKFTLRPVDQFTNPVARYREKEIVLMKGVEFEVRRVSREKMTLIALPPTELTRPDAFQMGVNNVATGKLFMVLVGETEEQIKENISLMNRVFDLVNCVASGGRDDEEWHQQLTREALDLQASLGLANEADDDQGETAAETPDADNDQ